MDSQPAAFRDFVDGISESIRDCVSHNRPWSELLDRSAFTKPESLNEAAARIGQNSSYFTANYVCIVMLILVLSLLSHPFSLILLLFLAAAWLYVYLIHPSDQPLVLYSRTFSDAGILGLLILSTLAVIFLTSAGPVFFYALMLGGATILLHSVFRAPDDFALDEEAPADVPSDSSAPDESDGPEV